MVTCLKAKKLCLLSQTKVNGAVMFRMCVVRFGVIGHEVGSTLRRPDPKPSHARAEEPRFSAADIVPPEEGITVILRADMAVVGAGDGELN
jgi:hypothetical protein